jgi:hypothetical protein
MTMVAGMHLGEYVLIVADTRISYFPRDDEPRYEDGRSKIYRTKLGLISGAGAVGLLDAVRLRLCNVESDDLSSFADVHQIIEEERTLRAPEQDTQGPLPEVHPAQASWLFTYYNPAPDPAERLRMGVMTAGDSRSRILLRGESQILFPTGLPKDVAEATARILQKEIRLPGDGVGITGDILQYNVQLARGLIRFVAAKVPGVSPDSYQVGLYTRDLMWAISDVMDDMTPSFTLTLQPYDAPWPPAATPRVVARLPREILPALRAHLEASSELEEALSDFVESAHQFVESVEADPDLDESLPVARAMADAEVSLTTFRDLVRAVNHLCAPLLEDASAGGEVDVLALAAAIPAAAAGAKDAHPALVESARGLRAAPPGQPTLLIVPLAAALTPLAPLIKAYSDSLLSFRRIEATAEESGEG